MKTMTTLAKRDTTTIHLNNNNSSNSNTTTTTTISSNSNNIPLVPIPLADNIANVVPPTSLALFKNGSNKNKNFNNINNNNNNSNVKNNAINLNNNFNLINETNDMNHALASFNINSSMPATINHIPYRYLLINFTSKNQDRFISLFEFVIRFFLIKIWFTLF